MTFIMNAVYFAGFFSILLFGVLITNIMILARFPIVRDENIYSELPQEDTDYKYKSPLESNLKSFMEPDSITRELENEPGKKKRKFRRN